MKGRRQRNLKPRIVKVVKEMALKEHKKTMERPWEKIGTVKKKISEEPKI